MRISSISDYVTVMLPRPYRQPGSPLATTRRGHPIWNSVLSTDLGERGSTTRPARGGTVQQVTKSGQPCPPVTFYQANSLWVSSDECGSLTRHSQFGYAAANRPGRPSDFSLFLYICDHSRKKDAQNLGEVWDWHDIRSQSKSILGFASPEDCT
jgi:hypothetical protein